MTVVVTSAPRPVVVAAAGRDVRCRATPSGPGGSKQPPPSRGPGAAPLRMQTDDQRKFGYGGDGCACTVTIDGRVTETR